MSISIKDRIRLLLNRNNFALNNVQFDWNDDATILDLMLNLNKALGACQSLKEDASVLKDALYLYNNWNKIHEFMHENAENYHKLYNPQVDFKQTSNRNSIYITDVFNTQLYTPCIFSTLNIDIKLQGLYLYENKYNLNEYLLEVTDKNKIFISKADTPVIKISKKGKDIITEDTSFFYLRYKNVKKYNLLNINNNLIGKVYFENIERSDEVFLKFTLIEDNIQFQSIIQICLLLFSLFLLYKNLNV